MSTTQIVPLVLAMPVADTTAGAATAIVGLENVYAVIHGPVTDGHYYLQSSDAYGVTWVLESEIGTIGPPADLLTLAADEAEKWEVSETAYYLRIYRVSQGVGTPTGRIEGRI